MEDYSFGDGELCLTQWFEPTTYLPTYSMYLMMVEEDKEYDQYLKEQQNELD